MSDSGGDPACWLERVCDECGAFVEAGTDHVCRRPARPRVEPGAPDSAADAAHTDRPSA